MINNTGIAVVTTEMTPEQFSLGETINETFCSGCKIIFPVYPRLTIVKHDTAYFLATVTAVM